MNPADLRREYALAALDEAGTAPEPFAQFQRWFTEAQAAAAAEPNAMTLATADALGVPSARIVLLKGIDVTGLLFFTDYRSRKGSDLAANPHAAVVFHWPVLERQVRVAGGVELLDPATSTAYYHSRPRGSQLGAWASHQSTVLADRAELDRELAAVQARYPTGDIPRPPYWGGYRLVPREFEFWQGRANRLHDRIRYTRTPDHAWQRDRLAP